MLWFIKESAFRAKNGIYYTSNANQYQYARKIGKSPGSLVYVVYGSTLDK
jgi:hypothetical protein